MGLDASVGEYETPEYISERLGSYGGYAHWRQKVAEAAGFDLDKMEGFGGTESWEGKPFPLVLNHSDCDGEYTFEQIPELMTELIAKMEVSDNGTDIKGVK
jgi:hypothetical protein